MRTSLYWQICCIFTFAVFGIVGAGFEIIGTGCAAMRRLKIRRLSKILPLLGLTQLFGVTALPLVANAQPRALDAEFLQDAGFMEAGPVRIYPIAAASVGYDSNIYESAHHAVDSTVSTFEPEISALLPFNSGAVQVGAQSESVIYSASRDDSVTDTRFYGRSNFEAGARNRFTVSAALNNGHEARGTGLTEGLDPDTTTINSPDAYTDKSAALKYEFGAKGARGHVRLATDFLDHSYDNHRDRTRFFDRKEIGYGATFLWRIFPRTALAIEGRERHIEYDQQEPGASTLDSRETSVWVGAEWNATKQTEGAFRVGHKRKDFDAPERTDGSDLVWELTGSWQPRSYSKFELMLDRSPNETNGAGDFIDTRDYTLKWTHNWLKRISTQLALSYKDQSYQNSITPQDEKTKGVQAGVQYQMRDWLIWHLDASWRNRDSQISVLEFERHRYWLTAELRL